MGGSAGAGGSPLFIQQLTFDRQANMDKNKQRMFPGIITSLPDRGPRLGSAPGTEATQSTQEATQATGAVLDRRRRTAATSRLTAPRSTQRRTLLGE